MTLPPFDDRGNLPAGIYQVSWTDFQARFAANSHRQQILVGLKQALRELASSGCQTVYSNPKSVGRSIVRLDMVFKHI